MSLDVGHYVLNGLELLGILIGYLYRELLLEGHYELNGVKRIGTEVVDELSAGGYLLGVNAELVDDDFLYLCFNVVGHKMYCCLRRLYITTSAADTQYKSS